jgi:hypothetical protein
MDFTRWRMARKYGTLRDLVSVTLSDHWERFWLCTVRRQHQEKFGSHGACYRCAKAMR